LTIPITILFLAAAAQTVKVDQYPLRSGCSESDPVVAKLHAGDPVAVKFSLAGGTQPCFVVSATVDGKTVEGNLPASALTGIDEFERARRDAAPVGAPSIGSEPSAPKHPAIALPVVKSSNPEIVRAVQLLDRNQPDQALDVLQKVLKLHPGNPQLLALCGSAAYKSDNLRLALQYWKESFDIQADPQVEGVYQAALRESQNDKSAEKTFGARFLLRYDGAVAEPETAHAMVAILDEEFSRISLQLGCRADERIVTIIESRDAFMKTTGAPGWSGGGYDGKIRIPILDRTQPAARERQVFAHELVHACLANIGAWPAWLHEGLAQRLSGEPVMPGAAAAVKALAKEGKLPNLAGLGQNWGNKNAAEAQFAYGMARVAVDLFFEYHAGLGIRNLLNNPDSLPAITEDLDKRLRE
jgi:tetratricopeptide (TPR) repeat protein